MFPLLGGIFFDRHFKFADGDQGEKLFVVLGLAPSDDYIVARTTSNPTHKSWKTGCHNDEAEPSFFISASAGVFPKNTWICLDHLFDLDKKEFERKLAANDITQMNSMPVQLLKELMQCAAGADDATQQQVKVLRDTLAAMK